MDEEYFTIDEVAKRFKVTRGAVYKWMRSGELPFVFVGRDRRITGTALRAFVRPGNPDDVREEKEDRLALTLAVA
jgi:excisionase family DNA binding protein